MVWRICSFENWKHLSCLKALAVILMILSKRVIWTIYQKCHDVFDRSSEFTHFQLWVLEGEKINHDAIDISNDYPCNFTSKAQIDSFYAWIWVFYVKDPAFTLQQLFQVQISDVKEGLMSFEHATPIISIIHSHYSKLLDDGSYQKK